MLKVRKLRKSLGIWKSEIAQKVNVNQTAVSEWERSTVASPLNNAKRLADVPGCAIDKLGGALLGWRGLSRDYRRIGTLGLRAICRPWTSWARCRSS
ncbi:helix-turn-helix domain-containing protein [Agathobaculum sp.]|uniref:helix-turn-helix domain-containing protein n=1 Tax=Agathobaculum sp. TaxID=2048138 RepID=UPI0025B89F65|nr:helix-turn-helix transcriptional regulator [Agathobaculum sp.]